MPLFIKMTITTKLQIAGMRNLQEMFGTCKRLFIKAFPICMTVPLTVLISRICLSLKSRCFLSKKPITLCLTDLYFHGISFQQKNYLEKFGSKSIFQSCPQNGTQNVKNLGYSKLTVLVLINRFGGMIILIFRRESWREQQ